VAEKDYYSFEEALRELSLREEELKRLVSEGEIRAFREGQTMKLRRADVDTLRKELSGGDVVDLGETGETVVFEDDAMTTQEIGMTTEEIVGLADDVGVAEEEVPAAATVVDEPEEVAEVARAERPRLVEVPEEYEGGLMRTLVLVASLLMLVTVPLVMGAASMSVSGVGNAIAGLFK
jgi:excisionase family DNA binding protein